MFVPSIVVDLFMENLEVMIIVTTPIKYKPRHWTRYANDVIAFVCQEKTHAIFPPEQSSTAIWLSTSDIQASHPKIA